MKPPIQSRTMSEEQKKRIGDGNRGKKRSPEICANLSEQRKGRTHSPPTAETIEKIRQSNLGKVKRKWTEEEKIQHRANQKARWANKSELERAIHGERIKNGNKKAAEDKFPDR